MKNQRIKSHIVWLAIISAMAILTSCGGDDPVKMEVINGISVPPEPDPVQNNATVAGVDANSNGVRDDVERKIASNNTNIENELVMAKAIQKIIINSENTNDVDFNKMMQQLYCLNSNSAALLVLNTPERSSKISALLAKSSGEFIDISTFNCEAQ